VRTGVQENADRKMLLNTTISGSTVGYYTTHYTGHHSKERFSPRKLIPVNPKTVGDHLLLKRIQANLSQPDVAVKAGVSVRKVKAWKNDQIIPTADEWRVLTGILHFAKIGDLSLDHFFTSSLLWSRNWRKRLESSTKLMGF
jgi:DNA-binding transcriptional regulator YiaG